jgi:hypothetical protein
MNLSNDGLTLWYCTPDTPGPFDEEVVPRLGVSLVLGAHPANPTNSIVVSYRVDSGIIQTLPGRELRTDYARATQYFLVTFPRFVCGDLVEYWPLLSCGGRQAPAAYQAWNFARRFRLEAIRFGIAPGSPTQSAAGNRS